MQHFEDFRMIFIEEEILLLLLQYHDFLQKFLEALFSSEQMTLMKIKVYLGFPLFLSQLHLKMFFFLLQVLLWRACRN